MSNNSQAPQDDIFQVLQMIHVSSDPGIRSPSKVLCAFGVSSSSAEGTPSQPPVVATAIGRSTGMSDLDSLSLNGLVWSNVEDKNGLPLDCHKNGLFGACQNVSRWLH